MTQQFLFTQGLEFSDNETTRQARVAECRAHAARIAHQRRKAGRGTKTRHVSKKHANGSSNGSPDRLPTGMNEGALSEDLLVARKDSLWRAFVSMVQDRVSFAADEDESVAESVKTFQALLMRRQLMLQQPESHVFTCFDQQREKRAFHLWTTAFSHRAAKFGVYCSDAFFRIIPQRALASPMIRHMILAHSFASEHWKAHQYNVDLLPITALHHYTKGLRAMYGSEADSHDFLAAIIIAFLIEVGQGHQTGATQHVQGYEKAITMYDGIQYDEYQTLKGCYYTMKTYGELWTLGGPCEQTDGVWDVAEARSSIVHTINKVEEYAKARTPSHLHEIKTELGRFLNTDSDQHRRHDDMLNRDAMLLLLHMAVTILPSDVAGWLSLETYTDQVNHLLSVAGTLLKKAMTLKKADRKELDTTLAVLAKTALRNAYGDGCQERATELLQSIVQRNFDLESSIT